MIGVVGGGAWGTALASLAATNGHDVHLWLRDADQAEAIQRTRENRRYLPGVPIPGGVRATADIRTAVEGAEVVVHVVPSHATREVIDLYKPYLGPDTIMVSATKGLDRETYTTMGQVIEEATGRAVVALSGPNHAEEVGLGQPAGAVAAHPRYPIAQRAVQALGTRTFKVYAHPDRTGVELCGAYKNVVAVATGLAAGLGYGDNTQSALITLGLHEMAQMLPVLGGERRTSYGLAGIGDLVATCMSKHSRNRYFGRRLGEGATAKQVREEMGGKVVEGYYAARAFREAADHHGLPLALTRAIAGVTEGRITVDEAKTELVGLV